jgi:hypothetical protein
MATWDVQTYISSSSKMVGFIFLTGHYSLRKSSSRVFHALRIEHKAPADRNRMVLPFIQFEWTELERLFFWTLKL